MTFYFLLAVLEGLAVTWMFAAKPVDPTAGSSLQRILLVAAAAAGVLFFSGLTVRSFRKPKGAETFFTSLARDPKKKPLVAGLLVVFVAGWIISFLPSNQLNAIVFFYERIRPAVLWITLVAGQTLVVLLLRSEWKTEKRLFKAAALALGVFVCIWILMALTGVGVRPDDRYWNEAGAPLLWLQILLAWAFSLAVGLVFFSGRGPAPGSGWKKDLLICALLFLAAAYLWSQTPVQRSYFSPGPYPPNNVFYPYSDSQIYDVGAQQVLIGRGLNNGELSDKPFYVLLVAILRMLVGQDYSKVMRLQAVFLAFFPVILYFIGKLIHSRTAGLTAGILAILWETNSIAATLQIQVSQVRLMLTEFPTAFALALAALVLILWLKNPRPTSLKLMLLGGILGAAALTRSNSLLLLPLIVLMIGLLFGRSWKKSLSAVALLVFSFLLVISPWYLGNKTPSGSSFLEEKIRAVIQQRYEEIVPTPAPVSPHTTPTPAPTATAVATLPPAAAPGAAPAAPVSAFNSALQFVPAHFLHNLDMSFLILPLSLQSNDLSTVLEAPYWKIHGVLNFSSEEMVFLFLNLLVLAVGIGAAWKSGGLAGMAPLLIYFGYYLANALARNSGGRYLVPVNWVVILYFALGLIQLGLWGAALLGWRVEMAVSGVSAVVTPAARPVHWTRNAAGTALGLLLVGSSLLLVGIFFPVRYPPQSIDQLISAALARGSLQKAGVSAQQVTDLVKNSGGNIVRGRALYPNYGNYDPSAPAPDLKLTFQMIGPVTVPVILPMNTLLDNFPDAADVTVIGCGDGPNLWAQAVIIEGSPDVVYLSSPAPTWRCP